MSYQFPYLYFLFRAIFAEVLQRSYRWCGYPDFVDFKHLNFHTTISQLGYNRVSSIVSGSRRSGLHLRVGVRGRRAGRRLQLRRLRGQHVDHLHQFGNQRRPNGRLRRVLLLHARVHLQQRQERLSRRRSGACLF